MQAAVLADEGVLQLQDRPAPQPPSAGQVLLQVEACGLCGTDLKILSDPPAHPATVGITLGHEIAGTVHEVADAAGWLAVGQRVVVDPIVSCQACTACRQGAQNHCQRLSAHGVFTDGGLAPLLLVDERSCHPIDSSVPPERAALGEPLATVLNGVAKAAPLPGDVAVVLGAGPIGLLWTALLRSAGAEVLVAEPSSTRRALAGELGAVWAEDPSTTDVAAAVAARTGELGADIVVDAVGKLLAAAMAVVRRGGRVVSFGMDAAARPTVPQIDVAEREITIVGSFVGKGMFPRAVRILERGDPDLTPLISAVVGMEELPGALQRLRTQEAVKIIVDPRRS